MCSHREDGSTIVCVKQLVRKETVWVGGSPVLEYRARYSVAAGSAGSWSAFSYFAARLEVPGLQLAYSVHGLLGGATYLFTIAARNESTSRR